MIGISATIERGQTVPSRQDFEPSPFRERIGIRSVGSAACSSGSSPCRAAISTPRSAPRLRRPGLRRPRDVPKSRKRYRLHQRGEIPLSQAGRHAGPWRRNNSPCTGRRSRSERSPPGTNRRRTARSRCGKPSRWVRGRCCRTRSHPGFRPGCPRSGPAVGRCAEGAPRPRSECLHGNRRGCAGSSTGNPPSPPCCRCTLCRPPMLGLPGERSGPGETSFRVLSSNGSRQDHDYRRCEMKSVVRAAFVLSFPLLCASAIFAYGADPAAVLAKADWSKMDTVTVTMTEYAFSPSPVVLKEGIPSKLVLKNEGKEAHYFVAEGFFRTIATRKIQGTDGEVNAPYFSAVEVYPGKSIEWFLVPMEKGTYELVCTVKGHAEHGMKGKMEVRGAGLRIPRNPIPCGGWCPRDRYAEDGRIGNRYPLTETLSGETAQRTEWNVRDSDGTLVLTRGVPSGGTALTIRFAKALERPILVVDLVDAVDPGEVRSWIRGNRIAILNVAGPRIHDRT